MSEFNEDHNANGTPGQGSQPALPHHRIPFDGAGRKGHRIRPQNRSTPAR